MSSDFLAYVDIRLQQWAEWFSRSDLYGIGFRVCTLEYRLMTEGALINGTAPKQFRSNTDAEEIEALVKELERSNKKVGMALRYQYFLKESSRDRAKRLGVCHAHFRNLIDHGRFWLAGKLSR